MPPAKKTSESNPNAKHLVIVESPAKARTIERYLGSDYKVLASYGHVRQLPSKKGSVDVDKDFEPLYMPIEKNEKHVAAIRKAMKSADDLYLATDLDREGEAIAWHLVELVKPKPEQIKRIVFDEITKGAIIEAVKHPRGINQDLVSAQETRQTLDYLYGFTLSPFLWKKIRYGLSAGRVQSVALRLIVEREREIEAFKPDEYWTLDALLKQPKEKDEKLATFGATLAEDGDKKLKQFDLTKARAAELAKELPEHPLKVATVETKDRKRSPSPPFTTSTLQQEASRKLGFAARRTMRTAQTLYEGVPIGGGESTGLITYMRTDSMNLAQSALTEGRTLIGKKYGQDYVPESPRYYKAKKGAQEAHEAIRPTSFARTPDEMTRHLNTDQLKLYRLIWQRALASQMADAKLAQTTARIAAGKDGAAILKATGSQVTFPGFIKVYLEGTDEPSEDTEKLLPELNEGDSLELLKAGSEQHFTQPPPRFTEASLVKSLEEHGIGRPSTYASIITTIQSRSYVRLEERRFFPEEVGMIVSDLLTNHFAQYVDYGFTSGIEEELDEISEGKRERVPTLKEWWGPFEKLVAQKDKEIKKEDVVHEPTDKPCPTCGKGHLIIKLGRFGKFYACSRFPDCDFMGPLEEQAKEEEALKEQTKGEKCPECGAPMVIKRGRFGAFLGCSKYPDCKGTKPITTGVKCPECGKGELAEKKSKRGNFYGCTNYPKCKFTTRQKPTQEPCPKCQSLVTEKGKSKIACTQCDWEKDVDESEAEKTESAAK
ncbi:type I DNA topoisomerase [Patescibacteria group bacterium]|nr:type I DNA topoisomerase [Patescibacteria group bacterium]